MCFDFICTVEDRHAAHKILVITTFSKIGKSCSAVLPFWYIFDTLRPESKSGILDYSPSLLHIGFRTQLHSVKNVNLVLLPKSEQMPPHAAGWAQQLSRSEWRSLQKHISQQSALFVALLYNLYPCANESVIFFHDKSIHCIHWVSVLSGWTSENIEWVS